MSTLFRWLSASTALLTFGITSSLVSPNEISESVLAQDSSPTPATPSPSPVAPTQAAPSPSPSPAAAVNFSDVTADYWAQPFIQALAKRNIITGFADGAFKPDEPVDRAEFAAMIQKAFNQNPVRQLPPRGFKDVPSDYWGASAIEEAYEAGFMGGYPGELFLPNQTISKAQALTALANGLNLTANGSATNILSSYYTDAIAIPSYAVDDIAAATQANLVVNYPNIKQLNPQQPLTRAAAAAHLYQALVRLGQVQPLASNVAATNYIVGRTTGRNQIAATTPSTSTTSGSSTAAAPTTSTTQPGDIYALVSAEFTTLASALKAAGLAQTLEEGNGPFTVFAPTDQAFAALPKETLQRLLQPENREILARILRYHVVPAELAASKLSSGELKTLANRPINIQVNPANRQITVNDARVIQPNIQAGNGVIHAIDEVLIPPDLNLSKLGQ